METVFISIVDSLTYCLHTAQARFKVGLASSHVLDHIDALDSVRVV